MELELENEEGAEPRWILQHFETAPDGPGPSTPLHNINNGTPNQTRQLNPHARNFQPATNNTPAPTDAFGPGSRFNDSALRRWEIDRFQIGQDPLDDFDFIMRYESRYFYGLKTVTRVPKACQLKWAKVVNIIARRYLEAENEDQMNVAFQWYYGLPQIFLTAPGRGGKKSYNRLENRINGRLDMFIRGEYKELIFRWRDSVYSTQSAELLRVGRPGTKNKASTVTDNQVEEAAVQKILEGDMRRGINMLHGFGLADTTNPMVQAELRKRHPMSRNDLSEFDPTPEDEEYRLEIDTIIAREILRNQDPLKGVGPRGFRPHHLQCLANRDDEVSTSAIDAVLEIGRRFLCGTMPMEHRNALLAGLMLASNKTKEKTTQRPIKMEDIDAQWFCKIEQVMGERDSRHSEDLLPEQLGVGVSAGVETVVLGMQMELDMHREQLARARGDPMATSMIGNKGILTLDIDNAHNDFSRLAVLKSLKDKAKSDRVRFGRRYNVAKSLLTTKAPIFIRGKHGLEFLKYSEEGFGQGNPMTGPFYGEATNPLLKELTRLFPSVFSACIQDDHSSFGDMNVLCGPYLREATKLYAEVNLKVQVSKRNAYCCNGPEVLHQLFPAITTPYIETDDGSRHYGIVICKIPMGDETFVRVKLGEIGDEAQRKARKVTNAVMNKDPLAAIDTLYYSSQNLLEYHLRCVPSHLTQEIAEAMDSTLMEMYSSVASFDLFEESADFPQWNRLRAQLRHRNGGLGIRFLADRTSFLSAVVTVFSQISAGYRGRIPMWPNIKQLLGNLEESDSPWDGILQLGGSMAQGLEYGWSKIESIKNRFTQMINRYEPDWSFQEEEIEGAANRYAVIMASAANFGREFPKFSQSYNTALQSLTVTLLDHMSGAMAPSDWRAISYLATKDSKTAQSLVKHSWPPTIKQTATVFTESMANFTGHKSLVAMRLEGVNIKGVHGCNVDSRGSRIKSAIGIKGDHTRILHDDIVNLIAGFCNEAGIRYTGGTRNTCKNMFRAAIRGRPGVDIEECNLQGMIPDLVIDGSTLPAVGSLYDGVKTICDVKTLSPGQGYVERTMNVQKRADNVNMEYHNKANKLDRSLNGTQVGTVGPIKRELCSYGKDGTVMGLVVGPYGECSSQLENLIDFIACHMAKRQGDGLNLAEGPIKGMMKKKMRSKLGLLIHRGWSQLLIGRAYVINDSRKEDRTGVQEDPYTVEEEEDMERHLTKVQGERPGP